MKKNKILLAGLMIMASIGLTACGNPLKTLPEVSEDNLVDKYDEDEKTYGNQAVDRLMKELTKSDAIYGDVTSIVVYDREDNEDSKDKSELSLEIASETDAAEYVQYYTVTMKYDSDNKEWKAKDYEPAKKKDTEIELSADINEDDVYNILTNYVYSDYVDDNYIYFSDAEITDVTINDVKVGDFEDRAVSCTYDVTFIANYYSYCYTIDATFDCYFNPNSIAASSDEKKTDIAYATAGYPFKYIDDEYFSVAGYSMSLVEKELDESIAEFLSEEAMLEGAIEYGINRGYYYDFYITEDNILSYETREDGFYVDSYYAYRYLTVDVQIDEGITQQADVYASYYYSDSDGWYCDYATVSWAYDDNYDYAYDIDSSFKGTYEGEVHFYDDDYLGDIKINVTSASKKGIEGTVQYAAAGQDIDEAKEIPFEATYEPYYMELKLTLEDDIKYKKYYDYSYIYLYYNAEEGTWSSSSWDSILINVAK